MRESDHKVVLINGRTSEEIKTALRICMQKGSPLSCLECPYKDGACLEHPPEADALALIEHLEAERNVLLAVHAEWIECDNGGYFCSRCDHRIAFLMDNRFCPACGARMDGDANV